MSAVTLSYLGEKSVTLKSGRVLPFFPRDSWVPLLPGVSSKKELREVLKAISERASSFVKDLQRLRRSRLVRVLNDEGIIPPGDLLDLGRSPIMALPDRRDRDFRSLRDLPQITRTVLSRLGPRRRPDRARLLTEIYRHIHQRTGHWHDSLLRDILNELEPRPDNPRHSETSLKQWRYKHGRTQRT